MRGAQLTRAPPPKLSAELAPKLCKSYGASEHSSPDSFGGGAREDPLAHKNLTGRSPSKCLNLFYFPTHR